MMPNQKNIMTRYSFIILMMVLIGIAIICKAGVIMFAERQILERCSRPFCERKRNRSPNPRKHYLF